MNYRRLIVLLSKIGLILTLFLVININNKYNLLIKEPILNALETGRYRDIRSSIYLAKVNLLESNYEGELLNRLVEIDNNVILSSEDITKLKQTLPTLIKEQKNKDLIKHNGSLLLMWVSRITLITTALLNLIILLLEDYI
jgi:hypothetical protein